MREGVAVIFAQGALGGGADMTKDQTGGRLGSYSLEVGTVPGGYRGGEEAGRRAQLRVGVEADAEAIGVVLASSCVLVSCNAGLVDVETRHAAWARVYSQVVGVSQTTA